MSKFKAVIEFDTIQQAIEVLGQLDKKGIRYTWQGPELSADATAIIRGHKKSRTGSVVTDDILRGPKKSKGK